MEMSHKLDVLQGLAWQHAEDAYKLYVIQLLAEHVEEEEVNEEMLEWITATLKKNKE